MGHASRLILEYKAGGVSTGTGEVYLHIGNRSYTLAHGPYAKVAYEALKQFARERREGSGDWYEQPTTSGIQWREKI